MQKQIAVIGGGASGLMAAVAAAERGLSVTVFEKMPRPARKILVTGKGRCNVTNHTDVKGLIDHAVQNGRFLYSAFSNFNAESTIRFFENEGVPLKTERGNRVFPCSDKAMDIADALVSAAKRRKVVLKHCTVQNIVINDEKKVTGLTDENNQFYPFSAVILATGGLSYPTTGSTGDGYKMAAQLGHTVTALRPSLIGLNAFEEFCSYAAGLSLKNVCLTVYCDGQKKPCFSEQGEMLFTHTGISGPLVLSASAKMKTAENAKAFIDLKPALSAEQLDKRLLRDFSQNQNKDLQNALGGLLPQKMIAPVINAAHISKGEKVNALTKEKRLLLVEKIKALPLTITGFGPMEQAVITRGGVSVKEIDPKTLASKLIGGLYFAGEIIDIDALTGGFNLQIAFSTGYTAGSNIE